MTSVLWLRRDLRLADNPALLAARRDGPVLPVFIIDPGLWAGAAVRGAWLARSVLSLDESMNGGLCVRMGNPRQVLPALAREVGATGVHVSRETTPYGRKRDEAVRQRLERDGVKWSESGTPYAVGPGLVRKADGSPYKVFTPFARAWRDHGWPLPAEQVTPMEWAQCESEAAAEHELAAAAFRSDLPDLPEAGERAALGRWREFLADDLDDYATGRDQLGRDATSRLSPYLKVGAIHPRTLLADLAHLSSPAAGRLRDQIAWREFYADVAWHQPRAAWHNLNSGLDALQHDTDGPLVDAWRQGRTGYPAVDAGMRELVTTGWMHNRARMVTASFLTKDLHLPWQVGARWFLDHLVDGDLASNNLGWQWVAGTGTDASPYNRVFNPVTQGQRFDPDGSYVRRWVPELRHIAGAAVHEPWRTPGAYDHGYPRPVVDHQEERREALRRFAEARRRST